jgi:hypothetical protein
MEGCTTTTEGEWEEVSSRLGPTWGCREWEWAWAA